MIAELLSIGEQNTRTCNELATVLNIDARDVRQAIRIERLAGELICSCSKGYYLPDNDADIQHTIDRLYKQGKENIRVADAMKRYHKRKAKQ